MNDQITIKNLEVYANHGVFPEEQKLGQKFIVSAILYTDTRKAGKRMIWKLPLTMEPSARSSPAS